MNDKPQPSRARALGVGYYRPSQRFRDVPEHLAVMDKKTGGLVALVGPAQDTPENLAATRRDAALFASSERLLAAVDAFLFQVAQGAVLERDAVVGQARAAAAAARGADADV